MTESWRARAEALLPEMADAARNAHNPMAFWNEVPDLFDRAYEEPRNEDLIRRIYQFAFWCLEHGERDDQATNDLPTCVVVCLYEHIPTRKASRDDMPRWFRREEVMAMRQTFSYHLSPGEFEELLKLFGSAGKRRSKRAK